VQCHAVTEVWSALRVSQTNYCNAAEMRSQVFHTNFASRGYPPIWMRSQERLDLLRKQEPPAVPRIRFQWKKSTDMASLPSDADRPKGPWHVYFQGTRKGARTGPKCIVTLTLSYQIDSSESLGTTAVAWIHSSLMVRNPLAAKSAETCRI
jgi:hypothetical protein